MAKLSQYMIANLQKGQLLSLKRLTPGGMTLLWTTWFKSRKKGLKKWRIHGQLNRRWFWGTMDSLLPKTWPSHTNSNRRKNSNQRKSLFYNLHLRNQRFKQHWIPASKACRGSTIFVCFDFMQKTEDCAKGTQIYNQKMLPTLRNNFQVISSKYRVLIWN